MTRSLRCLSAFLLASITVGTGVAAARPTPVRRVSTRNGVSTISGRYDGFWGGLLGGNSVGFNVSATRGSTAFGMFPMTCTYDDHTSAPNTLTLSPSANHSFTIGSNGKGTASFAADDRLRPGTVKLTINLAARRVVADATYDGTEHCQGQSHFTVTQAPRLPSVPTTTVGDRLGVTADALGSVSFTIRDHHILNARARVKTVCYGESGDASPLNNTSVEVYPEDFPIIDTDVHGIANATFSIERSGRTLEVNLLVDTTANSVRLQLQSRDSELCLGSAVGPLE